MADKLKRETTYMSHKSNSFAVCRKIDVVE